MLALFWLWLIGISFLEVIILFTPSLCSLFSFFLYFTPLTCSSLLFYIWFLHDCKAFQIAMFFLPLRLLCNKWRKRYNLIPLQTMLVIIFPFLYCCLWLYFSSSSDFYSFCHSTIQFFDITLAPIRNYVEQFSLNHTELFCPVNVSKPTSMDTFLLLFADVSRALLIW